MGKKDCVVPNCSSNKNKRVKNISFHEFPSNLDIRSKWINSICRIDEESGGIWAPKDDWNYVCSLHFKESDYKESQKRVLTKSAIPTIFPKITRSSMGRGKGRKPSKPINVEEPPEDPEVEPEVILGDLNNSDDSDSDVSETWSDLGAKLFKSNHPTGGGGTYHEPEVDVKEPVTPEDPLEADMEEPEVVKPPKKPKSTPKSRFKPIYHVQEAPEDSASHPDPFDSSPEAPEDPLDDEDYSPGVPECQLVVEDVKFEVPPRKKPKKAPSGRKPRSKSKNTRPNWSELTYEDLPQVCPECGRRFYYEKHLQIHLKKHENSPNCFACDANTFEEGNGALKDHLSSCPSYPAFNSHIDVEARPYLCVQPNCSRSYINMDALWSHLNRSGHGQVEDTDFPCTFDGCLRSFQDKEILRRHVQAAHGRIPDKANTKILCQYCGALIRVRWMKNHHRNKHFDLMSPQEQAEASKFFVLSESKGVLVSKTAVEQEMRRKRDPEVIRAGKVRRIQRERLQNDGETIDECLERLERERSDKKNWKKVVETEEEKEARRKKSREYMREYFKKEKGKNYMREYQKKRIQNETEEERKRRLEGMAAANRERYAQMTPEEKRKKAKPKSKPENSNSPRSTGKKNKWV